MTGGSDAEAGHVVQFVGIAPLIMREAVPRAKAAGALRRIDLVYPGDEFVPYGLRPPQTPPGFEVCFADRQQKTRHCWRVFNWRPHGDSNPGLH